MVPADKLEFAVLLQLVQTFGDQKRLEAAIKKATPDLRRVAELKKELAELKRSQTETQKQKERLISAVAEGAISMTDTRARMDKLKAQEESIQSRQREVQFELDNIPDPEQVKKSAKWASGVLKAAMKDSAAKLLLKRDYEWRRELVLHSFTGVDNKGGAFGR